MQAATPAATPKAATPAKTQVPAATQQTVVAKPAPAVKPAPAPASATTSNTLPPVPKANIKSKQRVDTTGLVQSNTLKRDMADPAPVQEEEQPLGSYARKKTKSLKDYQPVRDGSLFDSDKEYEANMASNGQQN